MNLIDKLKQKGRELEYAAKNLSKEVGQAASEKYNDIRTEPAKFIADSAKTLGRTALTFGQFVVDEGIHAAVLQSIKEGEKKLHDGSFDQEQRNAFIERRERAAIGELKTCRRLLNRNGPEKADLKNICAQLSAIEAAVRRLEWYSNLPNSNFEIDYKEETKELQHKATNMIRELRDAKRELTATLIKN